MKICALGILVAFTCNFTLANEASDSTSAYDTSYKCEVGISSGLDKKNGVVSPARFAPNGEFFVTHTSDFPADVLDAYLRWWDVSEDQMAYDYPTKRELVSYVLFDKEELNIGDGYRSEKGSYWFRDASDNPTQIHWWKECEVYSFKENTQTRITCDIAHNKLFQMSATSGEFTYAYLGSMHEPKDENGYEGDSATIKHGTCKPYYP